MLSKLNSGLLGPFFVVGVNNSQTTGSWPSRTQRLSLPLARSNNSQKLSSYLILPSPSQERKWNSIPLLLSIVVQLQSLQSFTSTGIPGDGRCLFRAVVHGACLRKGKPPPNESRQKELADELREKVVDELIKRRKDTEWYLEDEFDRYVSQMRQSHVWGGEPELLMSSHVLWMPITVYMLDKKSNKLKIIAEYGQEYDKQNPIRVLYHGYGHYDALKNDP